MAVPHVGRSVDQVQELLVLVVVEVLLAGAGDAHGGTGGVGADELTVLEPAKQRKFVLVV